jgi:hypothetical protein
VLGESRGDGAANALGGTGDHRHLVADVKEVALNGQGNFLAFGVSMKD